MRRQAVEEPHAGSSRVDPHELEDSLRQSPKPETSKRSAALRILGFLLALASVPFIARWSAEFLLYVVFRNERGGVGDFALWENWFTALWMALAITLIFWPAVKVIDQVRDSGNLTFQKTEEIASGVNEIRSEMSQFGATTVSQLDPSIRRVQVQLDSTESRVQSVDNRTRRIDDRIETIVQVLEAEQEIETLRQLGVQAETAGDLIAAVNATAADLRGQTGAIRESLIAAQAALSGMLGPTVSEASVGEYLVPLADEEDDR